MKNKLLKRANGGFSLVELIVVIAIMAILVGVAVPVYSSYIEKTQKNKDIQMVDEIKHAIEIAAAGESWYQQLPNGGAVGTVVISKTGTTVSGENAPLITKALTDTFGDLSSLKLSYDGWKGTLSGNFGSVAGSSYAGNTDKLLSDVQVLTNALQAFVTTNGNALFSSTTGQEYIQFLIDNGVIADASGLANNSQAAANAATLFVAQQTTKSTKLTQERFVELWATVGTGELMRNSELHNAIGVMPAVAAEYARAEAMINGLSCDNANAIFNQYSANLGKMNLDPAGADATSIEAIYANIVALQNAVVAHCNDTTCENHSKKCNLASMSYLNTNKARTDALAYYTMLGQVNSSSEEVFSNINSDKLYSEGTIPDLVGGYMSVADVMNELQAGGTSLSGNEVVIVVSVDKNGVVEAKTYPFDFEG